MDSEESDSDTIHFYINHKEEHYRNSKYSSDNKNADNEEEDELTQGCDTNDESNGEDDGNEKIVHYKNF